MDKFSSANQSKKKEFNPNIILYLLLPILGLGIPVIIYIFTFSPILTPAMADEISYARFLNANNSHTFAAGWISTKEFFPFCTRYFMTFFANAEAEWTDILYNSVLCAYLLFSLAFLFFVSSLHAKKIWTYLVTALVAFLIGYYGLIATYDCNYFITYVSFILILIGFILHGIRSNRILTVRIIIAALSPALLLSAIIYINHMGKANSFTTINFRSAATLFSSPLVPSEKLTDVRPSLSSVSDYLTKYNIKDLYCTSDLTNQLIITTENKSNAIYTTDLSTLSLAVETDRNISSHNASDTDAETIPSAFTFARTTYIMIDTSDLNLYDDYLFYGDKIYSDNYYSIYRFSDSLLLTSSSIRSDFRSLRNAEYDTVILSMYDISTIDVSELYRTKLWNSYLTTNIFTEMSLYDEYNEQIFRNAPERYIFYVDPYLILTTMDNNSSTYTDFINNSIMSAIRDNPTIDFKFIFPSYYVYHYKNFTDADYSQMDYAYKTFIDKVAEYPNVSLNFFGYQEYLYANPYLYIQGSDSAYVPDIANTLLRETLSDNSHVMSSDALKIYVEQYIDDICNYPYNSEPQYDMSNTDIVILGDSIFGNFSDNTSIQSIVAQYSNANVICNAIGGACAAGIDGIDGYSLESQLNVSEINSKLSFVNSGSSRLVFIIEFGINDYINGVAIDNRRSPLDTATYSGAIRAAIDTINTNWPDSEIILLAPGHVIIQNYGAHPFTGHNTVLEEYRKAVVSLAKEYDCQYINLCEIGITKENCSDYLYGDQIHYNGRGRYLIGMYLLDYLTGNQ